MSYHYYFQMAREQGAYAAARCVVAKLVAKSRRGVTIALQHMLRCLCGPRQIILFAGHKECDGNSRALYDYLQSQASSAQRWTFVWRAREPKYYTELLAEHGDNTRIFVCEDFTKRSFLQRLKGHLQALYYFSCATYIFFDNMLPGKYKMLASNVVYLSHGCPPIKNVKTVINLTPFNVTAALVTSEAARDYRPQMIHVPKERTFISGHPRNDKIFNSPRRYREFLARDYSKILLWVPTFRTHYMTFGGRHREDSTKHYLYGLPLIQQLADLEAINARLAEHNCLMIIKPHPMALLGGLDSFAMSHIAVWTNDHLATLGVNIYELFADTDAMISDYSSIVFDFLLTENRVAYILDDLHDYKLGLALPNMLDYMPGEKIYTLDQFLQLVSDVASDNDQWATERARVNRWANRYHDGNNAQRLAEMFKLL